MGGNHWIEAGIGLLGTVVLGTIVYHFFPNAVGTFFEHAVNNILAQFP
jgi:uncharacterized membrane-anchored protein YhcB (DUF1043 family)